MMLFFPKCPQSPENILSSHFFHIEQKLDSKNLDFLTQNWDFPHQSAEFSCNAHVHPQNDVLFHPKKTRDFPHQSADFPTQKICVFPAKPCSRSLRAAEVCRSSGCFEAGPGGHHGMVQHGLKTWLKTMKTGGKTSFIYENMMKNGERLVV